MINPHQDQLDDRAIVELNRYNDATRPRCPQCGREFVRARLRQYPERALRVQCRRGHWWTTELYVRQGRL